MTDWKNWTPQEQAVLCFIQEGDKLLLIHKKRGLGKGKINAPGGRIDPGETPKEAAVRECQEEVGLTPSGLELICHLSFQFTNGYSLFGYVYFADSYTGSPMETEEADPFWCSRRDIPWEQMWEDDHYWLPRVLAGEKLDCRFDFDDDTMLSRKITSGLGNQAFLIHD